MKLTKTETHNFNYSNKTMKFTFAGMNMFWARLRPILARAASCYHNKTL